jgi:predicted nucleic acid-binding protein
MGSMSLLANVPEQHVSGLDTAPFIYSLEAHPLYGPLVKPFFELRVKAGLNTVVTSVVTLSEVLVHPLRCQQADLVNRYRTLLTRGRNVTLASINPAIAERAAGLRATYGIRLPDAFQIAACLDHGATHFLTNDNRLKKVVGLTVLVLDDYLAKPSP